MKTRDRDVTGSRRRGPVRPWLLLLALPLLLALSCGQEPGGERVANKRPLVQIVPRSGSNERLGYATSFHWAGFDMDGFVDHYQYAIDIPDSLGLDLINNPQFAGIAWHDTTATGAAFFFSTPEADTAWSPDSMMVLTGVCVGRHSLYVRAVDNEGGVSDADFMSFTAENVMPKTQLNLGSAPPGTILFPGRVFHARWSGVDPDCPGGPCAPAFYEWKLVSGFNLTAVTDPGWILRLSTAPWHRVSGDSTGVDVPLAAPGEYLFGIRAIDRAGAVEDLFHAGRNAVALAASSYPPGVPLLTVSEPSLGSFTFPNEGPEWDVEVAAGQRLSFQLSGDASAYGGGVSCYAWGVDVVDSTFFCGWTTFPLTYPVCFQSGGTHIVTAKARDTFGGVTTGTIVLRVIDFPRDRGVLYIDDFPLSRSGAVGDRMMDDRARAMLMAAGYAESDIHQIDTFGVGDLDYRPTPLKLSDLARYRLVVWSNLGSGYGGASALVGATSCPGQEVLRSYLKAGGAAWFYGQQVFGTFEPYSTTNCTATVNYDESHPLDYGDTGFGPEYLGLGGARFYNVKLSSRVNGMVRGIPTAGALAEQFPVVETDSTVYAAATQGGVSLVDALFTPINSVGLDTLYRMETSKSGSAFGNKPIAFRYLDPDPGSTQGPVAVFGFPFHLLKQGSGADQTGVQGMARSMIEWFRSHGG